MAATARSACVARYYAAERAFEVIERGEHADDGRESALCIAVTAFDDAKTYIGLGDSSTTATDTQTDLQAASNKLRKAMEDASPEHADSTSSAEAKSITGTRSPTCPAWPRATSPTSTRATPKPTPATPP
ncbi:hypothetical protein [Saccharopolyspora shandongensis]|uniref:hypothetical protein n=1 Tax=Saccharopolyspora shandongensis TaxID=418495 RepID=UPI0034083F1D